MAINSTNTGYFAFETDFHHPSFFKFMEVNGSRLSWTFTVIYVVTIFGLKRYMKKREKFDLRNVLAVWSGILAIFSIWGAVRTGKDTFLAFQNHGFVYTVCDSDYSVTVPTAFWCAAFTLSKAYELGDTLFIILRKKRLIFLHWYHHITVMLYVFHFHAGKPSIARHFMTMNYIVHAFMYTFYTFSALQFKLPKQVNISITCLQIMQMIFGLVVNLTAFYELQVGRVCKSTYPMLKWGILMYLSYFILFGHFFYTTYLNPAKATGHRVSSKEQKSTEMNGKPSKLDEKPDIARKDIHVQNGSVRQRKEL